MTYAVNAVLSIGLPSAFNVGIVDWVNISGDISIEFQPGRYHVQGRRPVGGGSSRRQWEGVYKVQVFSS